MTKYTTDLFSLDVAYNRTRGKDTDTGEYISSINPDTVTSTLNIPIAHSGFSCWVGVGTFADRSTHISSSYSKQPGYGVNDSTSVIKDNSAQRHDHYSGIGQRLR